MDDVAKRHGGTQSIVDGGYTFPLQLASGLLTLPLRVPTDHELLQCPMQISSDQIWEPEKFEEENTVQNKYAAFLRCFSY